MRILSKTKDNLTDRYYEYVMRVNKKSKRMSNSLILETEGMTIDSYELLVSEIAELSSKNKDHLLFYRGQNHDFKNKKRQSMLLPSIYRTINKKNKDVRFSTLQFACNLLISRLKESDLLNTGMLDLKEKNHLQWAILQHYEIYPTPLLDLTQSLRVACSFAFQKNLEYSYVYVFGMPYYTNRISTNSEDDLINIRLLSISPPMALRPYYQEAFAVGTEFAQFDIDKIEEQDFSNRLLAKYRILNSECFWSTSEGKETPIDEKLLSQKNDSMHKLCLDMQEPIKMAEEMFNLLNEVESILDNHFHSMNPTYGVNIYHDVKPKELLMYFKNCHKLRKSALQVTKAEYLRKNDDLNKILSDLKKITHKLRIIIQYRDPSNGHSGFLLSNAFPNPYHGEI